MGLKEKAYRGVGWSSLSGLISNGFEIAKYVVLARLLDPSDFGLLAMAMVIIGFSRIFADGGTSNAVIHFREQSKEQLSTLFWFNLIAGFSIYALIAATAPLFAHFYREPEVSRLLWLGGVILPVYASGALFEVLLRKTLQFKLITLTETIAAVFGFLTAIVLALNGWGVYALIWSQIVVAATMALFYLVIGIKKWGILYYFKPSEVWDHLRFGLYQMGERGLNIYAMRIDHVIIGRFFGTEILGAYHIAFQIILFPIMRLSPILNRVALPVFSSRQTNNPGLRKGYLKLMNGIIATIAPFFILASLTAPWLVPLLFGSGWEQAIPFLPLMAMTGILRMLGNPCGNIVLSKGKARLIFLWNLGTAIISTIVYLIGAHFTIYILLWLNILANFCYFSLGQWLLVNRLIELKWRDFFQALSPLYPALLISWISTWVVRNFLSGIWSFSMITDKGNNLYLLPSSLMNAWKETSFWYENALWESTGMTTAILSLFLILYLPLLRYFQSEMIREIIDAFRGKK